MIPDPPEPELYYVDASGQRADAAIHAELLASEEGSAALEWAAVRQACAGGMPLEEAKRLYLTPPTKTNTNP